MIQFVANQNHYDLVVTSDLHCNSVRAGFVYFSKGSLRVYLETGATYSSPVFVAQVTPKTALVRDNGKIVRDSDGKVLREVVDPGLGMDGAKAAVAAWAEENLGWAADATTCTVDYFAS